MPLPSSWWSPNPTPTQDRPGHAAVLTWLVSGATVLLFGCCAGRFLVLGIATSSARIAQQMPMTHMPPEAQRMMRPAMIAVGVLALGVMVLPALVNIVLGFRIQLGAAGPARVAAWVLIVHAAVTGLMLLMTLVGVALGGNLLAVLINLVLLGGYLLLLVATIRTLWPLGRGGGSSGGYAGDAGGGAPVAHDDEPWNAHLK